MKGNKVITIIGGTGNLGVPIIKFLLQLGFQITLIARNLEKAKSIYQGMSNIRIIEADLFNLEKLTGALQETAFLYLNLGTQSLSLDNGPYVEREGIANVVRAVNPDKIKQIIAISGLGTFDKVERPAGVDFIPNLIRQQGHEIIKESGIPYTFLHCSWFADSFVVFRRKNVYSVIGKTDMPIYFTNCYDFARHLAYAVGNPKAYSRDFPIQGREGITHPEAARMFLDIYDKEAKVSNLSNSMIKILSLFIKEMKFIKHMSEYFMKSTEEFIAEEFETYKVLGEPELSLTEYAEKLKREGTFSHLDG